MIYHLYAGGYTSALHHLLLNTAAPSLRPIRACPADNPSWLTLSGDRLYAASELEEGGAVTGWKVRRDGALLPLGRLDTPGRLLCHLEPLPGGYLACANYGSGSLLTVSTAADGRPDWMTALIRHSGHGLNPERQEAPHVHCCALHPDGVRLFVADLGLDRVFCYAFSSDGGLTPRPDQDLPFPPGAGPRHLAFAEGRSLLLAVTELGNQLHVFREVEGRWQEVSRGEVLPAGYAQEALSAALRLSPDGRRAYVSCRGADIVTVFTLAADGRLTRLADFPSGGHWPRDLLLSPDGAVLLAANQLSGAIALFPLDPETGLPAGDPISVECESVSSLVCVPAAKKG
ncbi:MAG: lactonase family protein [Clostridia bacterium]|nr:lactonase family protein [Clostridia bacterium]